MKNSCVNILALILAVILPAMPLSAQNILTKGNTLMRPGDIISKQRVAIEDPGQAGSDIVWDFRNIDIIDDCYRVEYCGDSSSMAYYSVDPTFISLFLQRGDTLFMSGFEDSTTKLTYSSKLPVMYFPFMYGDTLSSSFQGTGLYCDHNAIAVSGNIFVEADGTGTLLLTDKDTLQNVLRVHTLTASSVALEKDSIIRDSTERLMKIDEAYRWYARGYRYPVFELLSEAYYEGSHFIYNHGVAFRTLPDNLSMLHDQVNNNILLADSMKAACSDIIKYNVKIYGSHVTINYSLSSNANLTLLVSDATGIVYKRMSESNLAGSYFITFDLSGLKRGEYILYMNVNGKIYSETILND